VIYTHFTVRDDKCLNCNAITDNGHCNNCGALYVPKLDAYVDVLTGVLYERSASQSGQAKSRILAARPRKSA